MSQTEIERKILISGVHPDDAQEIVRIYSVLTDEKKLRVLDSWEGMVGRIKNRRLQMEEERMIVLARPLEALGEEYSKYLRGLYSTETEKNLSTLQETI